MKLWSDKNDAQAALYNIGEDLQVLIEENARLIDEVDWLEHGIAEWRSEYERLKREHGKWCDVMKAENARLRSALEESLKALLYITKTSRSSIYGYDEILQQNKAFDLAKAALDSATGEQEVHLTPEERTTLWNFIDDNYKTWSTSDDDRQFLTGLMNRLIGVGDE